MNRAISALVGATGAATLIFWSDGIAATTRLVCLWSVSFIVLLFAISAVVRHFVPGALDDFGLPRGDSINLPRARPRLVNTIRICELLAFLAWGALMTAAAVGALSTLRS